MNVILVVVILGDETCAFACTLEKKNPGDSFSQLKLPFYAPPSRLLNGSIWPSNLRACEGVARAEYKVMPAQCHRNGGIADDDGKHMANLRGIPRETES